MGYKYSDTYLNKIWKGISGFVLGYLRFDRNEIECWWESEGGSYFIYAQKKKVDEAEGKLALRYGQGSAERDFLQ